MIEDLLQQTASLLRPYQIKDAAGGIIDDPNRVPRVVAEDVPVKLTALNSRQQESYAMTVIEADHEITSLRTDIQNGDRFVSSDGRTFRVTGINRNDAMGGIETFYNYPAMEVKIVK